MAKADMVRRLIPLLALAAAMPASAADRITPKALRATIATLSDDGFEGRKPGTPGGERTEAWLVEAFVRAGLRPGAPDGLWRQPVTLVRRAPSQAKVAFVATGVAASSAAVAGDGIVLTGREPRVSIRSAPLVFVGRGTPADLEGADLRGAIALSIEDAAPARTIAPANDPQRPTLVERGAVGMITIAPPGSPWTARRARLLAGSTVLASRSELQVRGTIEPAAAAPVLALAGLTVERALAEAGQAAFRARRLPVAVTIDAATEVREIATANIVGRIPGSAPGDEAIMVTAHWDHIGLCRHEGAADRICNGANDNASGIAMLIEIGRALAAGPAPARSIYLVATTAEELGLLGARALAAAPPVPLSRIAVAFNLDTAAIKPAGSPVAMIGRGRFPAIDALVDATARSLGRTIDSDEEADVLIQRQDGWALGEAGVPSVMVSGSFSDLKAMEAYLQTTYHQPSDDLAHLPPLEGAAEDATLHVALLRAFADRSLYPMPTSPLETVH